MRNKILMLSAVVATVVAMATPASAHYVKREHVPVVAGAVVGTAVGLGIYHAWWGSSLGGAALPTTAAGAAAGGFIAGVATVALIHAATTPCTGFAAVFSPFAPQNAQGCVNGKYVGYKHRHAVRARY